MLSFGGTDPKDKPVNQFGLGNENKDNPTGQFTFNSGVPNEAFAPQDTKNDFENDFSGSGSIINVPAVPIAQPKSGNQFENSHAQPKSWNNFYQLENLQSDRAKIFEKFLDVTRQLLANLK